MYRFFFLLLAVMIISLFALPPCAEAQNEAVIFTEVESAMTATSQTFPEDSFVGYDNYASVFEENSFSQYKITDTFVSVYADSLSDSCWVGIQIDTDTGTDATDTTWVTVEKFDTVLVETIPVIGSVTYLGSKSFDWRVIVWGATVGDGVTVTAWVEREVLSY